MERTLIVFKPDAVTRGVIGEIITRFERAGLKIVGAKMLQPDYDHLYHHYETIGKMITRRGQEAFDAVLVLMQQTPVLAIVLEGAESISLVRKMVGPTEPKNAQPGTIRGDYAHIGFSYADPKGLWIPNLVHASSNAEEAAQEIAHWFSESELFEYESGSDRFVQPRTRNHMRKIKVDK